MKNDPIFSLLLRKGAVDSLDPSERVPMRYTRKPSDGVENVSAGEPEATDSLQSNLSLNESFLESMEKLAISTVDSPEQFLTGDPSARKRMNITDMLPVDCHSISLPQRFGVGTRGSSAGHTSKSGIEVRIEEISPILPHLSPSPSLGYASHTGLSLESRGMEGSGGKEKELQKMVDLGRDNQEKSQKKTEKAVLSEPPVFSFVKFYNPNIENCIKVRHSADINTCISLGSKVKHAGCYQRTDPSKARQPPIQGRLDVSDDSSAGDLVATPGKDASLSPHGSKAQCQQESPIIVTVDTAYSLGTSVEPVSIHNPCDVNSPHSGSDSRKNSGSEIAINFHALQAGTALPLNSTYVVGLDNGRHHLQPCVEEGTPTLLSLQLPVTPTALTFTHLAWLCS